MPPYADTDNETCTESETGFEHANPLSGAGKELPLPRASSKKSLSWSIGDELNLVIELIHMPSGVPISRGSTTFQSTYSLRTNTVPGDDVDAAKFQINSCYYVNIEMQLYQNRQWEQKHDIFKILSSDKGRFDYLSVTVLMLFFFFSVFLSPLYYNWMYTRWTY